MPLNSRWEVCSRLLCEDGSTFLRPCRSVLHQELSAAKARL